MKPYCGCKLYYGTCKCFYCKRARRANKPLCRSMKKAARQKGKKEANEQWKELLET